MSTCRKKNTDNLNNSTYSDTPENRQYKRFTFGTLSAMAVAFILTASLTIYRDPFFHYHAPLPAYHYPQKEYPANNERYLNDGISRNFSYDGIITGTSMTENIKASEADRLFDARFIKVPYAGAKYKEINDNLIRAFQADREIKYIIRALDYNDLVADKDAYDETFRYPYYLYNDNPFDDVRYVLNKSVLLNETMSVVKAPDGMGSAVNFDTYANWNSYYSAKFGARYVLATYRLRKEDRPPRSLTQEERQMLLDNLRQNVTLLADEHPETDFYLYFPPYSICYWDILHNQEETDWHLEAEQLAIEELLKHPNIRLYSFCDNFELVCNLDHYKDYLHYSEQVNTWILENLKGEEYLLTEDNYLEYLEKIRDFYHSYDYDALHSS
ncbi:MAG: hypothetical protein HFI07_12905 [Lachnospiraceae bacterium]|nr:hypothetical protein [Lachnospiraceae bacterium]